MSIVLFHSDYSPQWPQATPGHRHRRLPGVPGHLRHTAAGGRQRHRRQPDDRPQLAEPGHLLHAQVPGRCHWAAARALAPPLPAVLCRPAVRPDPHERGAAVPAAHQRAGAAHVAELQRRRSVGGQRRVALLRQGVRGPQLRVHVRRARGAGVHAPVCVRGGRRPQRQRRRQWRPAAAPARRCDRALLSDCAEPAAVRGAPRADSVGPVSHVRDHRADGGLRSGGTGLCVRW